MAHTDKTDPWWVQCADHWTPVHWCNYTASPFWRYEVPGPDCTLPDTPSLTAYKQIHRGRNRKQRHDSRQCYWEPDQHYRQPDYKLFAKYHQGIPRWYIRECVHAPQRAETRSQIRRALKEHRANGSVESEPMIRDARHNAWFYWY